MTGIGLPPIDPAVVGNADGSAWSGIIAAIVLAIVFGLAVWTYLRTRPVPVQPHEAEIELPKAA